MSENLSQQPSLVISWSLKIMLSIISCSNIFGFPGLCSCCPIKPMAGLGSSLLSSVSGDSAPLSPTSAAAGDQRTSSVAELRRKAQEHSAALLQSLQHVANFQQAAAAGLNFPLLPPLTLQAALQRKHDEDKAADAAAAAAKEANGAS
ncbi:unnamed protein product [Acanthoscelides obtectus]|uniref:OAR domain-containing protein n=1 Tax=Acanthoscelides obtectus TaxID=200917 RepID=A0A9P0KT79_ACAOB|nr:unnamed protein product [Acanthoscelides obtectus]CAK1638214.1 hypothetical protein AOBTE_LOCUS10458 [Acanthoscelides obtectus]